MIPLGGLSTQSALQLSEATRDKQYDLIEKDALNSREIEAFRERVGSITSAKDLVADHEVYSFVMKAFDLEDKIFGKAMMRKVLESDITDRKALVNRLTDSRIRDLYMALDFGPGGEGTDATSDPDWQQGIIDKFVERTFINETGEQNEAAGIALEFRASVDEIDSWLDILKNKDLGRFMRRALGIPDEVVKLDIDRQAELFADKFDLEKLKDPKEVERLVRRFAAISDALDNTAASRNASVQLMQSAVSAGQGGQFVPVTIDIPSIVASRGSYYR